MQWSKLLCQNCQNIHGNLVCLIFLSCRVLVKHGKKNKRHNSYKTGGQTLYGSHLKFILPTSSLRYHLFCDPNFYCHITICLTYFPIRKQKIPEVFQWSWTFPWRKRRRETAIFKKQPFVQNLSRSIWKEEVCSWLLLPQS